MGQQLPPSSAEADLGPLCVPTGRGPLCVPSVAAHAHTKGVTRGEGGELMCDACLMSLRGAVEFAKAIKEHSCCKWGFGSVCEYNGRVR